MSLFILLPVLDGPEFYNHDLAKALWHIGSISNDKIEKMAAYRNVGWKIKNSLGTRASYKKILHSMQMYFYLHKHILCGPDIFPDKSSSEILSNGSSSSLMPIASLIDVSWENIGPWCS